MKTINVIQIAVLLIIAALSFRPCIEGRSSVPVNYDEEGGYRESAYPEIFASREKLIIYDI